MKSVSIGDINSLILSLKVSFLIKTSPKSFFNPIKATNSKSVSSEYLITALLLASIT